MKSLTDSATNLKGYERNTNKEVGFDVCVVYLRGYMAL